MTRAPETTPEDAHIPQALGPFLQEPEKPIDILESNTA